MIYFRQQGSHRIIVQDNGGEKVNFTLKNTQQIVNTEERMGKAELVKRIVYVMQFADEKTLRAVYAVLVRMVGAEKIAGGTK